ncbi:MAG: hypothetical protein QOF52_3183 [Propionibacteriaceae bacterium]|jgi:hypothetical protein|nr:hypothetical protein [Propionibacteriaceae bacterium]MDX6323325.1 hypothetical protein [Propionibacteriaceae bacterium]
MTYAPHGDNDPDTEGSAVPPYEGRRETADVDPPSESYSDDARVAGATGPVASPADEQPADDTP